MAVKPVNPDDVPDDDLFRDIRALAEAAQTAQDPDQPDDIRALASGLTENAADYLSRKYNR
ncbi:hypothetical protein RKE29_04875 [Streptomyces sp. B1866]|uniref:hypothetical protein n=1 Tax=Streptomyces sp. B1866 TaxID=3075431 RepID=UPI0028919723|nr:hypothetical protein [Streptomyces sp. B1866]MDT3395981.1 hypothetical protein [Streptomyces sp. B1866]